jgi:hypothetical protein
VDDRAGAGRIETHLGLDVVDGAAPRQALPRLPLGDAGQLEGVAGGVVVDLEQAAAHPGLAAHGQDPAASVVVDRAAYPPQVQLLGEGPEGGLRIDGDIDGRRDRAVCAHW